MNEQIMVQVGRLKKLSSVMIIRGGNENDRFIEFIVFLSHFSMDIADHIKASLQENGYAKLSDFNRNKDIVVYIDCNDEQKTEEFLVHIHGVLSNCIMSKVFVD